MSETKNWRFCVVGNIIAQHNDADGKLLYGSKAFSRYSDIDTEMKRELVGMLE